MKKILIVGSDYYKEIYNGLLKSAKSRLSTNYKIDELLVPGVFEIPVTIAKKIKDYDGFLAQLNHFLKQNKSQFKDSGDAARSISEFTDKNPPLTGHWLVYKIHNETRYYLDICEHGADEYLKNEGLPIYKKELPELFNQ